MSPSHAVKNKKRYRYYVSQAIIQNKRNKLGSISRVPAGEVEALVLDKAKAFLGDSSELIKHLSLDKFKASSYIKDARSSQMKLLRTQPCSGKLLAR